MSEIKEILDKNTVVTSEGDVKFIDDVPDIFFEQESLFEYPEESAEIATPGASVKLADRALALADVMKAHNEASRFQGAMKARNVIDSKYGRDSENVVSGMMNKTRVSARLAKQALSVLNGDEGLRRSGFSEAQITASKIRIESDLSKFGPGLSSAPLRAKVVKKAQKSANRK